MCTACVSELCNAHTFIQKCIQAENMLNEIKLFKNTVQNTKPNKKRIKKKPQKETKQKFIRKSSICKSCSAEFGNGHQLRDHYKLSKECKPKQHICTICKLAFYERQKLRDHIRTHTKETPFECQICLKKFRYSQNLNRHKKIHFDKKPYKCEVCEKGLYV